MPDARSSPVFNGCSEVFRGVRRFVYGDFQDRHIQLLGHPSECQILYAYQAFAG